MKFGVVDDPKKSHNIQKKAIPFLGGVAIFLSFFLVLFLASDKILAGNLESSHWIGVLTGASILVLGGILDDKYDLSASKQIIFPVLAILCVIGGGVGIDKVTNPFGGLIHLNDREIPIFKFGEHIFYFTIIADVFTFLWLIGMTYTTKLLDGIDGLVSGITAIGAFVIFLFTTTTKYYQPDIAVVSLILAGACLGFLILNWHPAKIFLGEAGSTFLGFILGVLAIISGGKIAIALLIMGIPIMDAAWTIIRRLARGKNPFKFPDKLHLHHRLLALGLGHRKTAVFFYIFAAVFGLSGLFLQSKGKIMVLGILFFIMAIIVIGFNLLDKKRTSSLKAPKS